MATAFQNFVNEELPKRPYTLESTLTWGSGRILVTAGPGYGVETIPLIEAPVQSVNGDVGDVVITTSSIGAVPLTSVGALNGVAELVGGKLLTSRLPSIAVTEYLGSVASEPGMLALIGEKGDWCTRSDLGLAYIITGDDPSLITDWTVWPYPTAPVVSVNGQTGVVILGAADVNADPVGTALSQIAIHEGATDPHGDRAYAEGLSIAHIEDTNPHTQYALIDDVPGYAPVQSVNGMVGDVVLDAEIVGADAAGTAEIYMNDHVGDLDPHNQYVLKDEILSYAPVWTVNSQVGDVVLVATDVGADPAGTAYDLVSNHEIAVDPHGQYLREPPLWATGQPYEVDDYVYYRGCLFRITAAHTSGASFFGTGSTGSNSTVVSGVLNSVVSVTVNPVTSTANTATGEFAAVLSGAANTVAGSHSLIVGGINNITSATGVRAVIGGGDGNINRGSNSVITGGFQNELSDTNASRVTYSFVGGGYRNKVVSGIQSTIVGGNQNQIGYLSTGTYYQQDSCFIGGGSLNKIGNGSTTNNQCQFTVIVGGSGNTYGAPYSFIGGGQNNSGDFSGGGTHSAIVGGSTNIASFPYSFIGGGLSNTASGSSVGYTSVLGGRNNIASGDYSVVTGGYTNSATAQYSGILCGFSNQADSTASAVVAGQGNTVTAQNSVVIGGSNNSLLGNYSTLMNGTSNGILGNYCGIVIGESISISYDKNRIGILRGKNIQDAGVISGDAIIQNGLGASSWLRPADISHSISGYALGTSIEATTDGLIGSVTNRILAISGVYIGGNLRLAIHEVDFMVQSANGLGAGAGIWCGKRIIMVKFDSGPHPTILSTQTVGTDYVFGYTSTSLTLIASGYNLIFTFSASGIPAGQTDILANAVIRSSYNGIG